MNVLAKAILVPPCFPYQAAVAACHCRKLNPAGKRSRIGWCSWFKSRDDDHATRARLVSAIPASSDETSATVKPRRRWSKWSNTVTLENWQSEFLLLIWQVAGLAFLLHVGSLQSKEGDDGWAKIDAILLATEPKSLWPPQRHWWQYQGRHTDARLVRLLERKQSS
jgi:hypothetical protein